MAGCMYNIQIKIGVANVLIILDLSDMIGSRKVVNIQELMKLFWLEKLNKLNIGKKLELM